MQNLNKYFGIIGMIKGDSIEFLRFEAESLDRAKKICYAQGSIYANENGGLHSKEGNELFYTQTMEYNEEKGHGEYFELSENEEFEELIY